MRAFQDQREGLGGQLVRRAGGVQAYCARQSGQPQGVGLELAPNRPLADRVARLAARSHLGGKIEAQRESARGTSLRTSHRCNLRSAPA